MSMSTARWWPRTSSSRDRYACWRRRRGASSDPPLAVESVLVRPGPATYEPPPWDLLSSAVRPDSKCAHGEPWRPYRPFRRHSVFDEELVIRETHERLISALERFPGPLQCGGTGPMVRFPASAVRPRPAFARAGRHKGVPYGGLAMCGVSGHSPRICRTPNRHLRKCSVHGSGSTPDTRDSGLTRRRRSPTSGTLFVAGMRFGCSPTAGIRCRSRTGRACGCGWTGRKRSSSRDGRGSRRRTTPGVGASSRRRPGWPPADAAAVPALGLRSLRSLRPSAGTAETPTSRASSSSVDLRASGSAFRPPQSGFQGPSFPSCPRGHL